VQITLAPSDANTPAARLRVEQPASISGVGTFAPATSLTKERDAYVITLGSSATTVSLASK